MAAACRPSSLGSTTTTDDDAKQIGASEPASSSVTPKASGASAIYEGSKDAVFTLSVMNESGQEIGIGSGFAITRELEKLNKLLIDPIDQDDTLYGQFQYVYLITNHHVIENAAAIAVITSDGRRGAATSVLHENTSLDLAILVAAIPHTATELGTVASGENKESPIVENRIAGLQLSASAPKVGEDIFVIGSPQDYRSSLSIGVISGFRNKDEVDLLQFTAPISGGSSGGPVLNRRREVVGVVVSYSSEGQNINFAIAQNQVRKFIQEPFHQQRSVDEGLSIQNEEELAWLSLIALGFETKSDSRWSIRRLAACRDKIASEPQVVIDAANKAINELPESHLHLVHWILGMSHMSQQEFSDDYANSSHIQDARRHLELSLRFKPDFVPSLSQLSILLQNSFRWEELLPVTDRLIHAVPRSATAHNMKAEALINLGRTAEALTEIKMAIRFDPVDGMARQRAGSILLDLGEYELALDEYQKSLAIFSEDAPELVFTTYNNMAICYLKLRKAKQAMAMLHMARSTAGKSWDFYEPAYKKRMAECFELADSIK